MSSPARLAALRDAIRTGDAAKVALLLKAGVPADGGHEGVTWVRLAASLARDEIFDLLVERGARLDEPELLAWAVDGGGGQRTPSLRIVRRVLEAAPPDRDGATRALRFACLHDAPEIVAALLAAGADPDGADADGDTPRSLAAGFGRDRVVAVLQAAAGPRRP